MSGSRLWSRLRRSLAAASGALPKRIRRDERGAVAVEFALVAMPFFVLLGAIVETALMFMADQLLETATVDASRLIRTGQATNTAIDGTAMTHTEFTAQVCTRLYILFDCAKLQTDARTYTSFGAADFTAPVDKDGNFDASKIKFETGVSQGIVVVRVYYLYPLIFNNLGLGLADAGSSHHLLASVTAFRNEPYPW